MIKVKEPSVLWRGLLRIAIGLMGLAGIALGGILLYSLSWEPEQAYCDYVLIGFSLLTLCIGLLMIAYVFRRGENRRARLHIPLVVLLMAWANVWVLLPLILQRSSYAKGVAIYSELLGFDARLLIAGVVVAYMLASIMFILRHRVLEWSQKSRRALEIGIVASVAFLTTLGVVIGYRLVPLVAEWLRHLSADLPKLTAAVFAAFSAPLLLLIAAAFLFGLAIAIHPLIRRNLAPRCYKLACERFAGVSFIVGLGFGVTVLGLWSPLFYTCLQCQPEGRYTRLHAAAMLGRLDSVQSLLDAGMAVEVWDNHNRTPLMSALAGLGNYQWRMQRGEVGEDGLDDRANHQEVLELLLKRGASVDNVTNRGQTVLHHAALYNIPETVNFLIRQGAFASATDKDGRTPLHIAAFAGSKAVVELLLAGGADVDARDEEGRTPLDFATESGDEAIAELLTASGAVAHTSAAIPSIGKRDTAK